MTASVESVRHGDYDEINRDEWTLPLEFARFNSFICEVAPRLNRHIFTGNELADFIQRMIDGEDGYELAREVSRD